MLDFSYKTANKMKCTTANVLILIKKPTSLYHIQLLFKNHIHEWMERDRTRERIYFHKMQLDEFFLIVKLVKCINTFVFLLQQA